MKVAAFVIGLLGGLTAFGVSVFEEGVATIGAAVGGHSAHTIAGLGVLAWACAVAGIVGPCLVLGGRPKAGAVVTLLAGLIGFVAASAFWTPAGILLILSAIFGFASRPSHGRSRFRREVAAGERQARRAANTGADGPTQAAGGPMDQL